MKIRSNLMTNLCRNPGISKGFTYFFLPLYIKSSQSANVFWMVSSWGMRVMGQYVPQSLGGRTLLSKCPWLVMFPAGKYLATTNDEPSGALAFPTPSFLLPFHTIAVK